MILILKHKKAQVPKQIFKNVMCSKWSSRTYIYRPLKQAERSPYSNMSHMFIFRTFIKVFQFFQGKRLLLKVRKVIL